MALGTDLWLLTLGWLSICERLRGLRKHGVELRIGKGSGHVDLP